MEYKVLIWGYAKKSKSGMRASPATVLIKDKGKKILVDPGANKKKLLNSLKRGGLKPKDIDLIFITHYHPDHILNLNMFPSKVVLDGDTIYDDDLETHFEGKIPGTSIEVVPTPGHANEHASLLLKAKEEIVCVAGDLWWWSDDQKQKTDRASLIDLKDPYVKDEKKLRESRELILSKADYVIPGHGKMFKVEK
ncbi:MBL fold metallo-hydrolase [Candidatus Micrarchaeota archaeon]|nr:MBL fold metallo-hydrolase [Candidatus Micrarchaeota archaeon]